MKSIYIFYEIGLFLSTKEQFTFQLICRRLYLKTVPCIMNDIRIKRKEWNYKPCFYQLEKGMLHVLEVNTIIQDERVSWNEIEPKNMETVHQYNLNGNLQF